MKLLLLLAATAHAATVQYVKSVCGSGGAGNNFGLDKCIPLQRGELCADATGGFTHEKNTTVWGAGASIFDSADSDEIVEPADAASGWAMFSIVDDNGTDKLHIDIYEADNCGDQIPVSTDYAPTDIAFQTDATQTTDGYYLMECENENGGCVSVTMEVFTATGCAESDFHGWREIFVFPEDTDPVEVCTATHDISFVCQDDGTWNLNSHEDYCGVCYDNAASQIDANKVDTKFTAAACCDPTDTDVASEATCKDGSETTANKMVWIDNNTYDDNSATGFEKDECTADGGGQGVFYKVPVDPCAPPTGSSSNSAMVSAAVASIIGAVMILA